MAISRAQFEKETVPGLHAQIGLGYKDYPEQWSKIFETQKSERSFEEEVKLAGFGLARNKDEGGSVYYDEGVGEVWAARYVMQTYGLGFILTEEAIEDNLYESLGQRYSRQLGRAMLKTKEIICANVLNFAFNSGVTGGDGVSLCNVAHPTRSGQLNSNAFPIGTDLNEATLENMLISIGQFVDERGNLIAAMGDKLIIPQQQQFIAERILKSALRVGTADNDLNAMKEMGMLPGGVVVNRYLVDPDAWFVKTNVPDGLKLFQRVKMSKKTDGDFDSGNVKTKARERYAVGYTDPLGLSGSAGAT